jgi:hypothetical protein
MLPFEAIKAATSDRARVAPLLIQELKKFAADFQSYDRNDILPITAIYLLAQWEAAESFETVLDCFALDDKYGGYELGDLITENGPVILAALCRSDLNALERFTERKDISGWARGAAFKAMVALVLWDKVPSRRCSQTIKEEVAVSRSGSILEAFPNGFLGVLMPEEELLSAPRLKRGRRFDWLYERMVTSGSLESVLSKVLELPQEVWRRLSSETDHELRAALICLLTAALAAQGSAAIVGEPSGGWFWLPPWSLWQQWATQGLNNGVRAMALKGQPLETSPDR